MQGKYWVQAASDLNRATAAAARTKPGYAVAARELRQLASEPDTDETTAEGEAITGETQSLNRFFGAIDFYGIPEPMTTTQEVVAKLQQDARDGLFPAEGTHS